MVYTVNSNCSAHQFNKLTCDCKSKSGSLYLIIFFLIQTFK